MNSNIKQILGIIANSPQGIAIYSDANLKIRFVNQAMLALWGKSEEIVGHNFGDIFPSFTEQGFTDLLLNVWHSGITYRASDYPAELTIAGVKETRYFDFEYQAILDNEGNTATILHTSTDVTARKKAMQLVEEKDSVIKFNRELESLTNNLSHDLKNPLGVIKMGVQFMRAKTDMPANAVHKWCDTILDSIQSMEDILGHTLRVNQVRHYEANDSKVSMQEMIATIRDELKDVLGSPLTTFQTGQLLPLYGDRSLLQHLFYSIIGNAVRYSSSRKIPRVSISSEKKDDHIRYTIKDNGIGVPQKELDKLLTLFYRASNAAEFPGTGVGLSLASKILTRLGGKMTISSELDRYTAVTLSFPIPKN